MAEQTPCTPDEFWLDTPQEATGATETGEQRQYVVELTPIHCAGCEALARMQERDDLAARIARVEALHVRCGDYSIGYCDECGMDWPCDTIKALRGEDQ